MLGWISDEQDGGSSPFSTPGLVFASPANDTKRRPIVGFGGPESVIAQHVTHNLRISGDPAVPSTGDKRPRSRICSIR